MNKVHISLADRTRLDVKISKTNSFLLLSFSNSSAWRSSKSSTVTHGDTSANLQFLLRVIYLSETLVTFTGTQRSPHNGVTTRPIVMSRDTDLEVVGSTTTVLPGDMGTFFGNFPQTSCFCLAKMVTHCCSLMVPTLSGNSEPFHRHVMAMISRNCSHPVSVLKI